MNLVATSTNPRPAPARPAPDASWRARRAFTLIELLLALFICSIVMLAIHTVFYGAIKLRNKTTQAIEVSAPRQQALAILRRDLQGLMPSGGTFAGPLQSSPTNTVQDPNLPGGRRVSPEFYTSGGVVSDQTPWAEVQKVAYYLSLPTNQAPGFDLVRSVTRNLLPSSTGQPDTQWLLSGVKDVFFLFNDGMTWRDTWDSSTDSKFPAAIKVQVQLEAETVGDRLPEPLEVVVAVTVQPATNSTQTASSTGGAP